MIVDLHNHTALCRHAEGSMDEYAARAYELGTEYFGFADHAPMRFDEEYRMEFSQMDSYRADVMRLRSEFEGRMRVLYAYEVDFLGNLIDERVMSEKVDYFIGAVHFLDGGWGFDNPEFIGAYQDKNIDDIWREYFGAVEALANSNLFNIVAHLDLLKIFKYLPKTDVRILADKAMRALKKSGMAIEINTAGWRKPIGEQYPSAALLGVARELDIPITFGSDAHAAEQVGYRSDEAYALARSLGYDECAVFLDREMKMVKF
jgi:histidinol-phosphatase (PHP family)